MTDEFTHIVIDLGSISNERDMTVDNEIILVNPIGQTVNISIRKDMVELVIDALVESGYDAIMVSRK